MEEEAGLLADASRPAGAELEGLALQEAGLVDS